MGRQPYRIPVGTDAENKQFLSVLASDSDMDMFPHRSGEMGRMKIEDMIKSLRPGPLRNCIYQD